MGAGEFDYAQRDLRMTTAMFTLLTNDKEFAKHNVDIINGWLANWVPQCLEAARVLQPLWSVPDQKPPRFEAALDRAKNRLRGILSDLDLAEPKELSQ